MEAPRVAIVDYKLCNLDSIARAVSNAGAQTVVTNDPADLAAATHIILPGVGAFPAAMAELERTGMAGAIRSEVARRPVPFLGICLGMQLMATTGNEHGRSAGLGLISGEVELLASGDARERVPHMGWNSVRARPGAVLFEGVPPDADFYFVHSYRVLCPDEFIAAETPYCGRVVAAVSRGNLYGTQFHPEKSQRHGRRLLANFLALRSD